MSLTGEPWTDVIQRFAEDSADAARLAELVSLAVRIEPALLRRMRLEALPGVDAGAEADLWFSPLVRSQSPSGIILFPEAAAILRDRLAAQPARMAQAHAVVEQQHQTAPVTLQWEEQIAYLALSSNTNEIERRLNGIVKAVLADTGAGIANWAIGLILRLPPGLADLPSARLLWFAAHARSGVGSMLRRDASERERAVILAALPESPPATIYLRLLDTAVEFSRDPLSGAKPITVPGTEPLLMEVKSAGRAATLESIPQGRRHRVAVASLPVELRAADGRTWEVTPQERERVPLSIAAHTQDSEAWTVRGRLAKEGFRTFLEKPVKERAGVLLVFPAFPDVGDLRPAAIEARRLGWRVVAVAPEPWPLAERVFSHEDIEHLAAYLREPGSRDFLPFAVPALPVGHIARPLEDEIAEAVLKHRDAVAITGPEGSGRATVALAVARRLDVAERFSGGITCVFDGPNGTVLDVLTQICRRLTLEPVRFRSEPEAADYLRGLLEQRRCFVAVLDIRHGALFEMVAPRGESMVLFTADRAPEGTQSLDATWPAYELWSSLGAPAESAPQVPSPLAAIIMARSSRFSFSDPARAVFDACMGAVSSLGEQARWYWNAVLLFPARVLIPSIAAAIAADLPLKETGDLLSELAARSLIGWWPDTGEFWIHPAVAAAFDAVHRSPEGQQRHVKLGDFWPPPTEIERAYAESSYAWRYGTYHLIQARELGLLAKQFSDPDFLIRKWRATDVECFDFDAELLANEPGLADAAARAREVRAFAHQAVSAEEFDQRVRGRVPRRTAEQAASISAQRSAVVVMGTGKYHLPVAEIQAALAVGAMLGRGPYRLNSGGWQGVDHLVCRQFVEERRRQNLPYEPDLFHYVPAGREPDFRLGQRRYVPQGAPEYKTVIDQSQALVLIGGVEGTYAGFKVAQAQGLPVLPLFSTGGSAARAWSELMGNAQPEDARLLRLLTLDCDSSWSAGRQAAFLRLALRYATGEDRLSFYRSADALDTAISTALARAGLSECSELAALRIPSQYRSASPDVPVTGLSEDGYRWMLGDLVALAGTACDPQVQLRIAAEVLPSISRRLPEETAAAIELVAQRLADRIQRSAMLELASRAGLPQETAQALSRRLVFQRPLRPARAYLAQTDMESAESTANKASELLAADRACADREAIVSFAASNDAAERVLGYLAFEQYPDRALVPAMLSAVETEEALAAMIAETRPLWHLLRSLHKLPPGPAPQLLELQEFLGNRSNVDPGGECKRMLHSLLSQRAS